MAQSSIFVVFWQKLVLLVNRFKDLFTLSFFGTAFLRVYANISSAWRNSVLVNAFCGKPKAEDGLKNSIIYKIFYLPFAFLGLLASKRGVRAANAWQSTRLYGWFKCAASNLIALDTRFLGVFLLSGSAMFFFMTLDYSYEVMLAVVALSLVLFLFEFSLLKAIGNSVINKILSAMAGFEINWDCYDESDVKNPSRLIVALMLGVITGLVAGKTSLVMGLGIAGVIIVMFNAQAGLALAIFAIPFIPTMAAAGLAMLCFVSLLCQKIAAGDRGWKLDLLGILIISFMLLYFVFSLTSAALVDSMGIFLLYAVFIGFYFVVINTVKTKKQLYAMLITFLFSGLLVALYGFAQYIFKLDLDKQVWLDEEMFSDIAMRVFSTFDNPNVLGEYFLFTIPIAIAFMWRSKKFTAKFWYAVIAAAMGICLILTMSRGCWVAILVAAIIYVTFVDGKYWLFALVLACLLPSMLPDSIINRFASIGNLNDTSSSYRMFIWLGTLAMLRHYWFCGVGPGTKAYNLVYPRYAYNGIIAPHSHNLFLQLTCETGIAGLAMFVSVCFMFLRYMANEARRHAQKSMDKALAVAIGSSIVAFLVQGMFDYTFYNYRVFLIFWIYLGLGVSFKQLTVNNE